MTKIIVLHGLGFNYMSTIHLEYYLKFLRYDVTRINYPINTGTVDDCVDFVAESIRDITSENDRIVVIGQSMGGVIGYLLPSRGINISKLITIGSPLKGASILTKEKPVKFNIFSTKIVLSEYYIDLFLSKFYKEYTPAHEYLIELTKMEIPPPEHDYHCITMSYPFTDFDRCVFMDEGYFEEEHHTHLKCADHATIFANIRLWYVVGNLIE